MTSDEYHFVSHWRVPGRAEDVTAVLRRGADLPRWWPAVYLDAREVDPGNADGLGYTVDLHSKGWLPYTLRWRSRATEVRHPFGFTIAASGDFDGSGDWTFAQDGDQVILTFDWRIRVGKPLLRRWAFALRPVYELNHRWAMAKGEDSLRLELARRRATTTEDRAGIPPPPGPTFRSPVATGSAVAAGVAIVGLLVLLLKAGSTRR